MWRASSTAKCCGRWSSWHCPEARGSMPLGPRCAWVGRSSRPGSPVVTPAVGSSKRWRRRGCRRSGRRPRAESRTTYVTVAASGDSVLVYEPPGPANEKEFGDLRATAGGGAAAAVGSRHRGRQHSRRDRCPRARGHRGRLPARRRPAAGRRLREGLLAALGARPDVVKIGRIEAIEAGLLQGDATAVEAAVDAGRSRCAAGRGHRWFP